MMPTFEKMQGEGIVLKNISDSEFSEIKVTCSKEPLKFSGLTAVTFNGEELA
jgi:hypothetical protein